MEQTQVEVHKERFSFGQTPPSKRSFGLEEQQEMEFQDEEEHHDSHMSEEESVKEKHRNYRNVNHFLEDIHEESESQVSMQINDSREEITDSRQPKINFGFLYEKEFQEERPQEDIEYEQGILADFLV